MANLPAGQRRLGRPPKGTRDDTRRDLLDAARRLFAHQGYAATTVREIADEVGITDAAIYAHFGAKQELLDALIEESGPQLLDRMGFEFSRLSDEHPSDVLPEFFDKLVGEWERLQHREFISLLTREGLADVPEVLGQVRDRFRVHIERWQREGILRSDIPSDMLLWELITPLAAIRILHLNARAKPAERREAKKLARAHVQYFLGTAVA